jgi:SagB-type dehydrogenase family enzyme
MLQHFRYFLKDDIRQRIDFSRTDQSRGGHPPPIAKPCPAGAKRIELVKPGQWKGIRRTDLEEAIRTRESVRRFSDAPLNLDELSFLLWATQGIREQIGPGTALRAVPSAGARHALETYLCVMNVTDLETGLYRYLPLEHGLARLAAIPDLSERVTTAALGQQFAGQAAVTFVWTTIPYRMEWRYGLAAHKVIALDAGHVCQNLYLACQAVGAGTCAIAAYDQEEMDQLLGVDGHDEFTVYLAPVGKVVGPG